MKYRSIVSTQRQQLFDPSANRVGTYSVMWFQIQTKLLSGYVPRGSCLIQITL